MQNQQIIEVESHKHLGLYFSNNLIWHDQINYILEKVWRRIHIMQKLKFRLDRKSLEVIYAAFIRPILEYGDVVWDNCSQYKKKTQEIANGFPWVNNTSFVCPKLATVYEVCHIRYKSRGTIMKAVTFVVYNA